MKTRPPNRESSDRTPSHLPNSTKGRFHPKFLIKLIPSRTSRLFPSNRSWPATALSTVQSTLRTPWINRRCSTKTILKLLNPTMQETSLPLRTGSPRSKLMVFYLVLLYDYFFGNMVISYFCRYPYLQCIHSHTCNHYFEHKAQILPHKDHFHMVPIHGLFQRHHR